jgi:site-specific DNA-methyltransferase (adenine-specific)
MFRIYNQDCITGAVEYIDDKTVDLGIFDPPFGIAGETLHKHYNRDESNVIEGYVEAPNDYFKFSCDWLTQAKRILKDSGSLYIVSGWTNLHHLLNAIHEVGFYLINHIIWKFNFGVATKIKYVTSHYHILYLKNTPKSKIKFNTNCRFSDERDDNGRSLLYRDMEDVWIINKQYQPGEVKNKNKLPDKLVEKMIAYSSDPGDVVCDFFMGNFTTANCSIKMGRIPVGFEINPTSYNHNMKKLNELCSNSTLAF